MFQEEGDPMLKYNQMIARKMMHNTEAYCKAFPSPQLFGGRRLKEYIQSDGGLANAYPSTLAVRNNRANLQFGSNGNDTHLEGGNHLKKFNKWYASLADKVKPVNNINGSGRRRRATMHAGSGFSDFYDDMASRLKPVVQPISEALTNKAVAKINGSGRRRRATMHAGSGFTDFFDDMAERLKPVVQPISEALTKRAVTAINGAGRKPNKRGEIVKKIMKEKGLNLPMASKYVKEHNLYRP
jgi:hypothetical protein